MRKTMCVLAVAAALLTSTVWLPANVQAVPDTPLADYQRTRFRAAAAGEHGAVGAVPGQGDSEAGAMGR